MNQGSGPKTAEQVIRNLHNFNRKERDHLMKFALSETPSHPKISKKLWRAIRPDGGNRQRPDPTDMFVGMDYHLNWLYAALVLSEEYEKEGIGHQLNEWPDWLEREKRSGTVPIQPNQEDVDLLVAFKHSDGALHLVLIEAKLDSGWDSNQFRSKTLRVNAIKKASDKLNPKLGIQWRFLLASPSPTGPRKSAFSPSRLRELPDWMTEGAEEALSLPHLQFGPSRLYHVKRETDTEDSPWEVLRIQLRNQTRT